MITLIGIFYLLTNVYAHNLYTLQSTKCDYKDKETCLDNWPCVWCNHTNISNMTGCKKVSICGFDDDIYLSCEYKYRKLYDVTCFLSNTLFLVLIVIGYYASMIVIFGTVNKILSDEGVSQKTRTSITTVIAIMTVTPLVLTFIFKPVFFYFIFSSYLVTGLAVSCCVRIKKTPETQPINYHSINTSERKQ